MKSPPLVSGKQKYRNKRGETTKRALHAIVQPTHRPHVDTKLNLLFHYASFVYMTCTQEWKATGCQPNDQLHCVYESFHGDFGYNGLHTLHLLWRNQCTSTTLYRMLCPLGSLPFKNWKLIPTPRSYITDTAWVMRHVAVARRQDINLLISTCVSRSLHIIHIYIYYTLILRGRLTFFRLDVPCKSVSPVFSARCSFPTEARTAAA